MNINPTWSHGRITSPRTPARGRTRALLVVLTATCVVPPLANAQVSCTRDTIQLNTGFEHTSGGGGSVYAAGAQDGYYQVVYDPYSNTTEPRPASVVFDTAWVAPDPNTNWLSNYPMAVSQQNGVSIYEVTFCLSDGFPAVSLTVGARADDYVRVYLNETLNDVITLPSGVAPIHTGVAFSVTPLVPTTFATLSKFRVGRNSLMFRVENRAGGPTGFDAVVTVVAPGGFLSDPVCCADGGTIQGQKWNDLNGDGIHEGNEPFLSHWPIRLSDGTVTYTDANGYYYFTDLQPGTYVVGENQQSGWVQTFPEGGVYGVTLAPNQVVDGLDFGNAPCGIPNVTVQPSSTEACSNAHATFSIEAEGAPPLHYQWQALENGAWVNLVDGDQVSVPCGVVSGATTPTLTVSHGVLSDFICFVHPLFVNGRQFRCVVIGPCENNFSDPATLTVTTVDCSPPNDVCADAMPVTGPGTFPFDNRMATTDPIGPFGCDTGSHDLWWSFTPSFTGEAVIDTCGQTSLDTELDAFTGDCGATTLVACNDDACGLQSRITIPVVAGSPVLIRLASYGDASGTGTFTISQHQSCGNADFNGDGDIGTDADIEAFFACLAGNCCATCGSADFNGDGDLGTDADIESFFRVLAGGPC